MSCGGFTNLCRTEIWRMPLSDGHAWSALAVCPSPTDNLAPAEADGTDGVGATGALIVTEEVTGNLYLAARNLHDVDVRDVSGVDPVSLIGYEKVLITVAALKKFEELLG